MPQAPQPQEKPLDLPRTLQRALELHHKGRFAEAEGLYATILAARPDHFDALQMLGVIKLARGDHATALKLTASAMQARPNSPQALLNYGLVLNALDRHEEALATFDKALGFRAKFPEAHNNRGSVLASLGRLDEALGSYKRALALKPDYAEALYNLGNALRRLDRHAEAIEHFDRALALRPNYAKAHCNRGASLEALERHADALACFDRALSIQPDFAEALLNRCNALRQLRRYDEALLSIDRLIAQKPDHAEAHYSRGMLLTDFNRFAEAAASYERALALKPDYAEARWAACMAALPIVYAEATQIASQRADYERRLRALVADVEARRAPGDLSKGVGKLQPFFLAYQGRNDRDLQRLYGTLASRLMAERYGAADLPPPPAPGEPVRVGIVSGHFWQHSVWKVGIRGWVTQLDRRRFQLFGYHTGSKQDAETALARAHCHKFVQGPLSAEKLRQAVLADRPHVLLYPEIGMDHQAAALAAQRLAAVQCSYLGHPQTSGFPTVDYFLSGELIEPADGDEHYTEKLVRLPNIAFHYEPPDLPAVAVTRAELGLRPTAMAYWCAQSLFKYLPQHDEVFARIARKAGDCQFVFVRHFSRPVTDVLQSRLERVFAAHGLKASDHCVFLSPMTMEKFSAASALCDAMLDSIEWSGGNTTLEALAQDLPVVTFEGALMRGRVSAGILRMLGMPETIAGSLDDYVALGVRVAQDLSWRADLKRRIARDKAKLYRDRACIAALQDFLDHAVRHSGTPSSRALA
jgi:predicted O-linked N-acetylglucosamine transferase (SPINDLY family)